jgi:hypothetical protein
MQTTSTRQDFGPSSEAFAMELTALLHEQWDVLLWRIRIKENKVKLTLQACHPVDEAALHAWLVHRLGPDREIVLKFKPMSACCGSGCTGCLIGKPGGP